MSPFRMDVLGLGLLLSIPVIIMGWTGHLAPDVAATRVLYCLGAAWVAVTIIRWASTPNPHRPVEPEPGPDDTPLPPQF